MGKKKKEGSLGKTLIRDRFSHRNQKRSGETFLHTTELQDGYDWGRLNLQSVTEQSNLDDFLATAELAGTEFTAEKLNVKFIDPNKNSGLLSKTEQANIDCLHDQHRDLLRIPRRPAWDSTTSPDELDRRERATFLEWRKSLNLLSEVEGIIMTPYERNLDFWRQLWRVIERSDVVVQIVDARNPLLFRCEDVDLYVKEVNPEKVNLLLVNKADLLTLDQRKMWCQYFDQNNVRVAFWSALSETERQKQLKSDEADDESASNISEDDEGIDEEDLFHHPRELSDLEKKMEANDLDGDPLQNRMEEQYPEDKDLDTEKHTQHTSEKQDEHSVAMATDSTSDINNCASESGQKRKLSENENLTNTQSEESSQCEGDKAGDSYHGNVPDILNGEQLIKLFRSLHSCIKATQGQTTIGMVGYPNVGKSSTINAILKMKKVPVSATPGRTKHFQTLYVEKDLMLCDCPGLVFPSFVSTKAELVVNGILPIDQMRDHIPPVSLVCHNIPRQTLEDMYGINLPLPEEGEDPDRPPTAHEILNVYGTMRGFMTSKGLPDGPRTSRYILKDYVNGKLLFCKNPPGTDPIEFNCTCTVIPEEKKKHPVMPAPVTQQSTLDREFFRKNESKVKCKGVIGVSSMARAQGALQMGGPDSSMGSTQSLNEKPWKKHHNTRKREKLRRLYKNQEND